jgi:outer membrane protein assembly factor BamE
MLRIALIPVAAAAAAVAAGCGSVPRIPGVTPYKMEIQQGNYISQEMVALLKPGMSKDQVRFILGTPLLTDIFHADRWDYLYWREPPNSRERETRRLALYFEEGRLARVDGDVASSAAGR